MPDHAPTYLILGATGGIGSALSRRLAADGAHLLLAARDEAKLQALADELDTETSTLALDATRLDEVEGAVEAAGERMGRLDGVANCVGSILLKPAHLTTAEELDETLRLNLHTAFYTVRAAARAMMNDGGSIVLCASAAAQTGLFNHEAIAAAKGGIISLVRSAASTYAPRGIRINAVAPGLVETPLTARITGSEAGRKASEAMHPMHTLGQPDDVAVALRWLLHPEESRWVTGQIVGVDGGLGQVVPRG